jgi:hypothetical protein
MLDEYAGDMRTVIIRFAALFSDWCEYPPMFMFIGTWLSKAWNRSILGGRGQSAIPYLHVRDGVRFVERALDCLDELEAGEILIASPDEIVSHNELYYAVTHYSYGESPVPWYVPRFMAGPGIRVRCLLGHLTGSMPFERPWMAKYVDKQMKVDASYTRGRISWEPRVAQLLVNHREELSRRYTAALIARADSGDLPSYAGVDEDEHRWNHRLVLRNLINAVRTRDRSIFLAYCEDLAERRWEQGFSADDLCGALDILNQVCLAVLSEDEEVGEEELYFHEHMSVTIRFGADHVIEVFELMQHRHQHRVENAKEPGAPVR